MAGDLKPLQPGDDAPPPDNGKYVIAKVDDENDSVLLEWEARGMKFRCWVPKSEVSRIERRHQCDPGECTYCDRERARGNTYHPSHDASSRCQSGKHNHCSCGACF